MTLTHHTADLSHARLHYVVAGTGTPMLLLHGWPQTGYCWRKLVPLLSARYQMIMPDLTGLGDSESKVDRFDKRSIASDMVELMEHIGLSEFHLVGHDWGGAVAWAIAAHFPNHAKTLSRGYIAIP